MKTEYPSSAFMHSTLKSPTNATIKGEVMDHQDRPNHPIKFLDDGGNCDDCDDHMKARLSTLLEKINPCTANNTKTKFHALLGCGN